MEMINLTIDGQQIQVKAGTTVLEAARSAGIKIPTLCYMKEINEIGACRVCVVEANGRMVASCVTPVTEGMEIKTNTPAVREARKTVVELMISDHPMECLTCERNGKCELQTLAENLGIREIPYEGARRDLPKDTSSPSIVRDPNKCILCRKCEAVCAKIQEAHVLGGQNRGFNTIVAPAFSLPLNDVACTMCGQCIHACPVGAIYEKDDTAKVWEALGDPEKHVVVQIAPAVRVAIGEEFGLEPGTLVTGKVYAALRRLGFDKVFDTNFTADLTIVEEGHELIERLNDPDATLPMITSCSPGWIKYIEHFYPELIPHLSTCKSPQQMFGALVKTYYPEKVGIDPARIFSVSIMPCTAKKFEAQRPEMNSSGYQDVDAVLTTRELARMIKEAGIDFVNLPDEEADAPMGIYTGAGTLFGTTGGVMEAAVRTAYEVVTGEQMPDIELKAVRGLTGIKEAEVDFNGKKIKVAVAHGLGNARKLMDLIAKGEADYHFIEIMACPGGCIGGGGQPFPTNDEIRAARARGLYEDDKNKPLRKSHENPAVQELYKEFLKKPLGHKSHELLHTHYTRRGRYPVVKKSE
ncbi:ferredoxin [Anoxybacter fermentans]|uniref:Ferredoxin n=1 Tax=Anoxybacter fermentans TaxID=1323375 RepID=A0A3S9SYW0_9FIRM|nr:NADH-dependent [FeFe] hydrogenase, group A6 [Anoxybacter fermentans]AZR73533.1 ferredoxin [Anoxybacter fermentans]